MQMEIIRSSVIQTCHKYTRKGISLHVTYITVQPTTSFNKILVETCSGLGKQLLTESVATLESTRKDVFWTWQSSSFRQKK